MKKMKKKADALKMLSEDMMKEATGSGENSMKATITADSMKGLEEGAEMLPEVLEKAEKLRKKFKK
jgi:hypothetical protein|tara:strand:- start:2933 stop:3130 length:198 start_codon:yes stop_codon:yes gene_type:complete